MKTRNYDINLMTPGQSDKETYFNQAMVKLDNLINLSAQKLVKQAPTTLKVGERYILSGANDKSMVCYSTDSSGRVETITAPEGTTCYVKEENCFYIVEEQKWKKLDGVVNGNPGVITEATKLPTDLVNKEEKFFGINEKYELPVDSKNLYLYMNGDCELDFQKIKNREFTIIIKQNWQKTFKLTWPYNVLWANKVTHKLTMTANAIDMVKFYYLIETQHFIAEIIGQNYQF